MSMARKPAPTGSAKTSEASTQWRCCIFGWYFCHWQSALSDFVGRAGPIAGPARAGRMKPRIVPDTAGRAPPRHPSGPPLGDGLGPAFGGTAPRPGRRPPPRSLSRSPSTHPPAKPSPGLGTQPLHCLVFMATFDDIQLLRIQYLRGPNIWTYRPVLEVWLDLGALEEHPSHRLPGFNERLTAWLPALIEHHCGVGERGGFLQ